MSTSLSFLDSTSTSTQGNDFSTIPNALVAYARNTVFSTWQSLERQLGEVTDPEMGEVLDRKADALFEIWLQFRGV